MRNHEVVCLWYVNGGQVECARSLSVPGGWRQQNDAPRHMRCKKDRYGRLLRYVRMEDDLDFGLEMIFQSYKDETSRLTENTERK